MNTNMNQLYLKRLLINNKKNKKYSQMMDDSFNNIIPAIQNKIKEAGIDITCEELLNNFIESKIKMAKEKGLNNIIEYEVEDKE